MDIVRQAHLAPIDYVVMAVYFAAVLAVGWLLRRLMRTSTDFFLSGRSLPPWVTGLAYILLGGLTSAIYNEVLQFFLIVFGFLPLVFLGLVAVGGWSGLSAQLSQLSTARGFPADAYTHAWRTMGSASQNPVGVEWFGLVMGLGFVLSFGYWCTDFLVVQRAMAAESMTAARRTPLIAALPKMFFPFLVILPGMIALVLGAGHNGGQGLIPPKL